MPDRITSAGNGADSVADTPESRFYSEVALFRCLPAEQLSKIEARMRRRTFPAGAHVITVEEPGETVRCSGRQRKVIRDPARGYQGSQATHAPRCTSYTRPSKHRRQVRSS